MPPASTLIVDRGDLPSLAACSIQGQLETSILWHVLEPDSAASRRRAAVDHHAAAWGIDRIIMTDAPELGVPGMAPPDGHFDSAVLLGACTVAGQVGCQRIVWPITLGYDREAIDAGIAQAETVTRLSSLSAGTAAPAIEMPLVDLSDRQIVDLVCDTRAPSDGFWPCGGDDEVPCRRCDGCRRWLAAFHLAGQRWPWPPPVEMAQAA